MSAPTKSNVAVLVIDDSDVDRAVMQDLLESSGFTVHELPSPIGATRKARELNVRVVIIDQNLPSLDGSKLAQLFRNNAGMQDVRVVLVSSASEERMLEITKEAKADAFVSKQNMHDSLVPTIKRLAKR